jgi:hypothetical protein
LALAMYSDTPENIISGERFGQLNRLAVTRLR